MYYYSHSTVTIDASISGQSCATISGIFVLIQSAIALSSDKLCDRTDIALVAILQFRREAYITSKPIAIIKFHVFLLKTYT